MRHATQRLHEQVEAALPLMDERLTLESYRQHVRALWPVVWATERALLPWHECLVAVWGHPMALLPRAPLLGRDAAALTPEPAALTMAAPPLIAIPSLPHALGCWYVLGGSRLGGQVIVRRLQRILHLGPSTGLAYYGACCPKDGTLFRQFAEAVDTHPELVGHKEAVLQGAMVTFTHWCSALNVAR